MADNPRLCQFFATGNCEFGKDCKFTHDRSSSVAIASDTKTAIVCKDFAAGACKHGDRCHYLHGDPLKVVNKEPGQNSEASPWIATTEKSNHTGQRLCPSNINPGGTLEEIINDIFVVFGPGAEVKEVKLPSQFSHVQILGLPITADRSTVMDFLKKLGVKTSSDQIQIQRTTSGEQPFVTVEFEDPNAANHVLLKAASLDSKIFNGMSVKSLTKRGRSGCWVQSDEIVISWYERTKRAMLVFNDPDYMTVAKNVLSQTKSRSGRLIKCVDLVATATNMLPKQFKMGIVNLDWDVTEEWIYGALEPVLSYSKSQDSDAPPLHKIQILNSSFELDEKQSAEAVRQFVESIGPIKSFGLSDKPQIFQLEATAVFQNPHHASQTATKFRHSILDGVGRISLEAVKEITFNIPNKLATALAFDLQRPENCILMEGKVKLKRDPFKRESNKYPYITVQLWGKGDEASKYMALARVALENLLLGTPVLDNKDQAFWHPFFQLADSLHFLSEVSSNTDLHIHRDLSRELLLIYGGTASQRVEARRQLFCKVQELNQVESQIVPVQDVPSLPTMVRSSECTICYSSVETSIVTSCGHTYCSECLVNQLSAADENSLPLKCHGNLDSCRRVFELKELKELVTKSHFDALLALSLKAYIRTNPAKFALCPSPDCTSVYQVKKGTNSDTTLGSDEHLIFCATCLSTICTTCRTLAHGGISCARNSAEQSSINAFNVYKAEYALKDCPCCLSVLEKDGGCNHVVCSRCSVNICWECMSTFAESDACYSHMRIVHGGSGLDGDEDEDEDEDMEEDEVYHYRFPIVQVRALMEEFDLTELIALQRIVQLRVVDPDSVETLLTALQGLRTQRDDLQLVVRTHNDPVLRRVPHQQQYATRLIDEFATSLGVVGQEQLPVLLRIENGMNVFRFGQAAVQHGGIVPVGFQPGVASIASLRGGLEGHKSALDNVPASHSDLIMLTEDVVEAFLRFYRLQEARIGADQAAAAAQLAYRRYMAAVRR